MTTQAIVKLTEHIRQVSLTRSRNSRKELCEMADAFEAQAAELLTALGRIAVGSKTILDNDAMTEQDLRRALAVCIELAEKAIGAKVSPKLSG